MHARASTPFLSNSGHRRRGAEVQKRCSAAHQRPRQTNEDARFDQPNARRHLRVVAGHGAKERRGKRPANGPRRGWKMLGLSPSTTCTQTKLGELGRGGALVTCDFWCLCLHLNPYFWLASRASSCRGPIDFPSPSLAAALDSAHAAQPPPESGSPLAKSHTPAHAESLPERTSLRLTCRQNQHSARVQAPPTKACSGGKTGVVSRSYHQRLPYYHRASRRHPTPRTAAHRQLEPICASACWLRSQSM
ncbi:hypothetical protein L1887_57174 [Cichorium endivia]|nr:hypothetical protein L1887_57174 [Cichorium endivia]